MQQLEQHRSLNLRSQVLPWVLACLGVVLTVSLGQWQTRRAQEKLALQQHLEHVSQAPPVRLTVENGSPEWGLEWQHVIVRGEFLPLQTIYLDNRVRDGVVGFYVLTPFQLAGTERSVLVNRGWIPRDVHHASERPVHGEIVGPVEIEGVLQKEISQTYLLSSNPSEMQRGVIWQRFGLQEYARQSGLKLLPWIVFQLEHDTARTQSKARLSNQGELGEGADGLVRDWKLPALGVEKHRAYAFQWYAMACAIVVLAIWLQWKKIKLAMKRTYQDKDESV